MRFSVIAALGVVSAGGVGLAQVPVAPDEQRTLTATRMADGDGFQLDGRLVEAVWDRAVPATGFVQQDPDNGSPATERTEVRVLYDRDRLVIGVQAFDSEPGQVLGNQMQRDASFDADDRFMLAVDPFLDERSGYYFEVNPSGAMGDGLINAAQGSGGGINVNRSWDGVWDARVTRDEGGWSAELEIPFRTLNFAPDAPAWGINFQRTIRRKNEEVLWTGFARNQGLTRMTNAGRVEGIGDISQGIGLDVKPFLVGTITQSPGRGAPAAVGDASTGVDFFYSLTPRLRANLTVNTDFAETQVDERVVNLTRFAVSFPERREFFLEGANLFNFAPSQGNQYFSRRIGLDERGQPQGIDFGLKLTGQTGAFDIGALQVRTRGNDRQAGEDFTVVRPRRRIFQQSYVGMLYTRRSARDESARDLHAVGVDFGLTTSAFRGDQNIELLGFYIWNTTPVGAGGGAAYGLRFAYPNDPFYAHLSFREFGTNHAPAVGFTPRNDFRRYNPRVSYSWRPQVPWIRSVTPQVDLQMFTDLDNRTQTRNFEVTPAEIEFHSGDIIAARVLPSFERLDRGFQIHDGIMLPGGTEYSFTRYQLEVDSADQRVLGVQAIFEWGPFFSGTRREVTTGIILRPRTGVAVDLNTEWNQVRLAEGSFLTRLYRGVVNTQFNPRMSLVNDLQYDTVTESLGWQLRWRWIVQPGNDMYFVYTHNWLNDDPEFRRALHTLDRRAATKLTYTHRF